jgi:four helix bundle protein
MSRDPRKLDAFVLADALVVDVYRATQGFPREERYGLQSQIRRGAISIVANLVEGSDRRSQRDYHHFVGIALGSASEVRYLIELAGRLGYIADDTTRRLTHEYARVIRGLQALSNFLAGKSEVRGPRSEVP